MPPFSPDALTRVLAGQDPNQPAAQPTTPAPQKPIADPLQKFVANPLGGPWTQMDLPPALTKLVANPTGGPWTQVNLSPALQQFAANPLGKRHLPAQGRGGMLGRSGGE